LFVTIATSELIIEAHNLVKRYGDFTAVDHLDLEVRAGEIFGILGPNGAGKTTTLEMMEGLREPDGGSIRVAGIDAVADPDAVRRVIGVQLQTTALFPFLSGAELIELFASLYDVDSSPARIDQLLKTVDLSDKRGNRVDQLSGGQQQRLSITLALVNNPKVVFLDEPTTGLDPRSRRAVWQMIRELVANGTTVFLTTQYLEEADQLADRIALLDHGRIVAEGTPEELKRLVPGGHVSLRFTDPRELEAAARIFGEVARDDDELTLQVPGDGGVASLRGLLDRLDAGSVDAAGLSIHTPDLDDVFLALTGQPKESTR
jgi:ABC-2 type transport system ATP-binding protein